MNPRMSKLSSRARTILLGTTMLAGAVAVVAPALAQEAGVETVVVTGIRASLQSAQAIKQNSDQMVDSITAVDIGALPDRSVAEALQRVPGVQITRTDANTDPLRWAGYGNGVFIRGLSWVQSLTNGEEIFGAENGRSISFADISADLMQGVNVYKNPDASMIEGGIGGVVDLKTRKPFDFDGLKMAASANLDYDTLGDKSAGSFNALISDRFDTNIGEIGVLFSADYQNLISSTNLVSTDPWLNTGTVNGQTVHYPKGYTNSFGMIGYRRIDWKQPRVALDATVQWRPTESLEITFTSIFSKAEPQSAEHNVAWIATGTHPYASSDYTAINKSLASYTYDEDGYWNGGTIYNAVGTSTQANYFDTRFDVRHHINKTFQLQAKWNPTNNLQINLDGYYIDSRATMSSMTQYNEIKNPAYQAWNGLGKWWPDSTPIDVTVDLKDDSPSLTYTDAATTALGTQSNALWAAAMDHYENNYAHAYVSRGDATYTFDGNGLFGIVKSVNAGFRLNFKQAVTKSSAWNWGRTGFRSWGYGGCSGTPDDVANNASQATRRAHCLAGIPDMSNVNSNNTRLYEFGDIFGHAMPAVWEPTLSWMKDPHQVWADTQAIEALPLSLGQTNLWTSLTTKYGVCSGVAYKCEYPYAGAAGSNSTSGVSNQKENTYAGYAQINYARDSFLGYDVPIDGNIGVRVVQTEYDSGAGYLQLPTLAQCPAFSNDGDPSNDGDCTNWNEAVSFVGGHLGGNIPYDPVTHNYTNVLPSLNFRAHLSDTLQMRLAYSQGLVRPPLAQMRNYNAVSFHWGTAGQPDSGDPDLSGTYATDNPYTGSGSNPYLKPTFSHNWDMSMEWFFAPTGSVSFALFHKTISNYIMSGQTDLTISRNGITKTFTTGTYANGDHGQVEGLEVAYQQFYDQLPGALSGLGFQANYTKLYNHGGRNSLAGYADADAERYAGDQSLPMENMSNDSFNVALMYEKYDISARIAYNWRSTFLVNSYAVNLFQPVFQRNYGQLDASVLYTFLDHYKIGFQATNVLKQSTVLQIGDSKSAAHSFEWVEGDRKLSMILRASF
jgi:TonB-dependent receptor